jgi:hypothetical protein
MRGRCPIPAARIHFPGNPEFASQLANATNSPAIDVGDLPHFWDLSQQRSHADPERPNITRSCPLDDFYCTSATHAAGRWPSAVKRTTCKVAWVLPTSIM